jgi:hypothetical protein
MTWDHPWRSDFDQGKWRCRRWRKEEGRRAEDVTLTWKLHLQKQVEARGWFGKIFLMKFKGPFYEECLQGPEHARARK